ncbi:chloride channel protein [Prolixibacteraceae bacterium JC049]|nr:chloride channel protein [Prolixibacteraceae bacterium JC049]
MKKYITSIIDHFITWRVKHIPEKSFIYILSFVIGIVSGLAAILLKNTIHTAGHALTHWFKIDGFSYFYLAYPLIGILLTVFFVKYLVRDNIGHGVSKILYAISKKNSYLKPHNQYTSMLGSTLTIGFGGSVGAEAPIVLTGASIGSNMARMMRLNYKAITLMVGCGAAGAIGGIFKAPLAGLLFTLEVLMLDLTMASLIPLLISSVTAAVLAYFFMGDNVLLNFSASTVFQLSNIPFYILLGIACGLISYYFTRTSMWVESKLKKITCQFRRLLFGGVSLGALIFLFPSLWGEGYSTIITIFNGTGDQILNNSLFFGLSASSWTFLLVLVAILVFKVIAMALTNGSGGVGGIFAPTLFMGAVSGYLVALAVEYFTGIQLPKENFALVGMCGMMAGVMHAPMTAIFLIAEITGGFSMLIPLMMVATISYLTIMWFEPHSLYHKRLAQRGELITHHKDKTVLTLLKIEEVIEKDLLTINVNATLGELVKVVSKSRRNIFPVLDDEDGLVGIVLLDDIRDIMFQQEMYEKTFVHDLMISPPELVFPTDSMEQVMEKFAHSGAWNLPVVSNNKYLGFVSKAKIFNSYRSVLMHVSDE